MLDRFLRWLDHKLTNPNKVRQAVSALLLITVSVLAIAVLLVVSGQRITRDTPGAASSGQEETGITRPPEDSSLPPSTEPGTEPATGTPAPETDPAEPTGTGTLPELPVVPISDRSAAGLLADGWRIDWGEYNAADFVLAPLSLSAKDGSPVSCPAAAALGGTRTVTVRTPMTYEDGGIQFAETHTENVPRAAVELYMGYILVDLGADREGNYTLGVYASDGTMIGIFPAADLTPAYTRDSADRPLFLRDGQYVAIDAETGTLVASDYIDEVDGRGLYFDYNPDYGKSDCNIQIYHTYQTVKMTYSMNMSSYLTRYGVDYRIARQFIEKYPTYAELTALSVGGNDYYNKLFHVYYEAALREIAAEKEAGVYAPLPQTLPWESEETSDTPAETTEAGTEAVTEPGAEAEAEPATDPADPAADPAETTSEPEPPAPNGKIATVSRIFDAYRFTYRTADPGVDPEKSVTWKLAYTPYIDQVLTWKSDYKHARAYNFSEGRAVTVTDNGIMRVINKAGNNAIYLYHIFKTEGAMGGAWSTEFYIEPFDRDVTMLGYYYFDEGLMRMRKCTRLSYIINKYNEDRDILVDLSGREYKIPEGYTLVSYSEGVLVLERQGRYGYYHKDGYWIAQPLYRGAMPFVEGIAVLTDPSGAMGAIDKNGNVVIPFEYQSLTNASSGIFAGYSETAGWQLFAKLSRVPADPAPETAE